MNNETKLIDELAAELRRLRAYIADDYGVEHVFYEYDETEIHTWFERDRQHVELTVDDGQRTIVEWWDDEVTDAIEDGILDPRDYHGSAYDHARDCQLLHKPTMDVTLGATETLDDYALQTGDNSFHGLAYFYPYWGAGTLAREDSDAVVADIARDMVEQIVEQIASEEI